jgi:hypothetical protein
MAKHVAKVRLPTIGPLVLHTSITSVKKSNDSVAFASIAAIDPSSQKQLNLNILNKLSLNI